MQPSHETDVTAMKQPTMQYTSVLIDGQAIHNAAFRREFSECFYCPYH